MTRSKLVAASLLALSLSACNSSEESCRFEMQTALDTGNYQKVIDRLTTDQACIDNYREGEHNVDLGSAYMGRSGLTMTQVVSVLLEDDAEDFTTFVSRLSKSANSSALSDLDRAKHYFEEYVGGACNEILAPTSAQSSACLLTGFVDVLKATMAVDKMATDVEAWLEDEDAGKEPMNAATCALEFAGKQLTETDIAYNCASGATVDAWEAVVFQAPEGDDSKQYDSKQYDSIAVNAGVTQEWFLIDPALSSTIFTEGYCDASYAVCEKGTEACYACPLPSDGDDLAVSEYVLDALNSGMDNVLALVDGNEDIVESIEDFKLEIKPEGGDILLDDIINYLNLQ